MSPHRDQEGTAIRHAVYAPVCTCGWRGFSGCVVHPAPDPDPELDTCECGHYRFVHPDGGACRPMGRTLARCYCQAFSSSESDEQEPRRG